MRRHRVAAALALAMQVLSAPAGARAGPGPGAPMPSARWIGPRPAGVPRRVISLAPSLTDTVVALGLASKLVGVTRYDDAPEVARLPRVGGFLDPSMEAVLRLEPDLVLWMTDAAAHPAARRLAALGIPVLALPVVNVADVLSATRLVGSVLGDPEGGERLARSLAAEIEDVRHRAAHLPRPRVLLVLGRDPLVVAGPSSYPGELLEIAGGQNVVTGRRPWAVYPLEKAVAADPDRVLDAAVNEPAAGITRLSAIPAVRRGAVRRLENDDLLRPGPRLARALPRLLAALHPEAQAP